MSKYLSRIGLCLAGVWLLIGATDSALGNGNVHVTRFWHNHQPIYWPEWMGDGGEPNRGQLAWDSIQKKPFQNYGGISPRNNPENDLVQIFGLDDRKNAYQGGPRTSLTTFSGGGFAMSYSGSLIDNVRQLGSGGHLGYGSGWASGNIEARRDWGRLDLLGFTFHHSLAPLLPKEVFRKEIQIFKQAWWKAWGGNADGSDHSKGFFPTEMAYTRDLIDVLVDEGYEWVIVASHHISRTSPSYNDRANPTGTYNIYSSPPNKADQLSPRFDNPSQWWYGEPNPGNAAWNVAPFAYQLHRVRYVNPETGGIKDMFAVPSDDVLSYRYGYANEGIGKIVDHIAPHANVPVIVMPSTDGDNAWGGGSSSWMEATPQLFNESASRGYQKSMPGTFVNLPGNKQNAPLTHIEDGAWVFPKMCYGSPNFMKWIEPPLVSTAIGATNRYPGTQADMETPGYSLKFFSYAPLMAGANWVITAEQILRDQGGSVRPWVVHAPYGVGGGEFSDRNDVELAWHIYLKGLDSGFNYYGGLGNDDEVKPSLATKRAVDRLRSFMSTRMDLDRTGPTALKPQRFPYNPGAYTFGWFNNIPDDRRFLKKMPSNFYIWTHVYDVSGVQTVNLKIRRDKDGVRSLQNTHNETYAGGDDVEGWVTIPMNKRTLPNTRAALNAAAANGEIDFFVYDANFQPTTGIEIADYYFARIDEASLPGFRGNLFDYYVETTDTRGNTSKSEIQHVWVEDDGQGGPPPATVSFGADPRTCANLTVTYTANSGVLSNTSPVVLWSRFATNGPFTSQTMSTLNGVSTFTFPSNSIPSNAPVLEVYFQNSGGTITDNRGGANYSTAIRDCNAPSGPVWTVPDTPVAGQPVTVYYNTSGRPIAGASAVNIHYGYNENIAGNWTIAPGVAMTQAGAYWSFTYTVPANATIVRYVFNNNANVWDNNGGNDFTFNVEPGGPVPVPSSVSFSADPRDCAPITVTYVANDGVLSNTTPVTIRSRFASTGTFATATMTHNGGGTSTYTFASVPDNAPVLQVYFTDAGGTLIDNASGANYSTFIRDCDAPQGAVWTQPVAPVAGESVTIFYNPDGRTIAGTTDINIHYGYNGGNWTVAPGVPMTQQGLYWRYTFTVPSSATNLVMAFNSRGTDPWDNNSSSNFVFAVQGGVPPPTGFVILTPTGNTSVAFNTTNFTLGGIAEGVSGSIAWTNALTGLSGLFPAASPWSLPLALNVGDNVITLVGTNPPAGTVTNGFDQGANYTGIAGGENEGTGFGPWSVNHSQGSGTAGVFIGDPAAAGISGMSSNSIGFYANPLGSGANAEIQRAFGSALAVGHTFSFQWGLNWDSNTNASNRGFNLIGDGTTELININMGGSATITINGTNMFTQFGSAAFVLNFTRTGANSLRVFGTGRNGSESFDQTFTIASAPQSFKFYFNATEANVDQRQMYVNDFAITSVGGSGSTTSTTVTITRLPEGGSGEIPSSWFSQYGVPSAPPEQETPGGGATYREAYMYDIDPRNPAPAGFDKAQSAEPPAAAMNLMVSPSSTGRIYDVYWRIDLNDTNWFPMNLNVRGNADGGPVMLRVTNNVDQRFYRTGVKLPQDN